MQIDAPDVIWPNISYENQWAWIMPSFIEKVVEVNETSPTYGWIKVASFL